MPPKGSKRGRVEILEICDRPVVDVPVAELVPPSLELQCREQNKRRQQARAATVTFQRIGHETAASTHTESGKSGNHSLATQNDENLSKQEVEFIDG